MTAGRRFRLVPVRDEAGREVGRARVYAGADSVDVSLTVTDPRMRDRVFIARHDELRFTLTRRAVDIAGPPHPDPLHPTHLRVVDPRDPDPEGPACSTR